MCDDDSDFHLRINLLFLQLPTLEGATDVVILALIKRKGEHRFLTAVYRRTHSYNMSDIIKSNVSNRNSSKSESRGDTHKLDTKHEKVNWMPYLIFPFLIYILAMHCIKEKKRKTPPSIFFIVNGPSLL